MPYTLIEAIANTTRTATLTSATCRCIEPGSHPKSVVSAPNGTTAKAANAQVAEMIGASANRNASAALGRSSSLNISLITSAIGCRRPLGPTRYGPSRCCSSAATLRSTYTIAAAEFSSMMKTKSVRAIWAMSSGVIRSTDHHEGTKSHEDHEESPVQDTVRGLRLSSCLRDASSLSALLLVVARASRPAACTVLP